MVGGGVKMPGSRGGDHPGDIVLGDQVAGSGIPRDLAGEFDLSSSRSSLADRLVLGGEDAVVGIIGEDAGWLAGWLAGCSAGWLAGWLAGGCSGCTAGISGGSLGGTATCLAWWLAALILDLARSPRPRCRG
jgi:hypothetical protein